MSPDFLSMARSRFHLNFIDLQALVSTSRHTCQIAKVLQPLKDQTVIQEGKHVMTTTQGRPSPRVAKAGDSRKTEGPLCGS